MSAELYETLKRAYWDAHTRADQREMWRRLRQVLVQIMLARQQNDRAFEKPWFDLLTFWIKELAGTAAALDQVLQELIQNTETENHAIQQQGQTARAASARLRQAMDTRQQWIERLALAVDVQRLEADPRWDAHTRAADAQSQAEAGAREIAARETELIQRAEILRKQLDG